VHFSPKCYNLPLEYTKLVAEFSQGKNNGNAVWICKPVGQSQGRGIFLFKVGDDGPKILLAGKLF
jgi:tubulin polyglutamylase TTLL2